MSRILVTALGRGRLSNKGISKYDKATYVFQDESKAKYETEFIAEALVNYYDIERIYIVGTAKSMWEQVYYNFTSDEERDEEYYLKLDELIEKSDHNTYQYEQSYLRKTEVALDRQLGSEGSRCYLIKYGLDRDELLYNFDILLQISEQLQSGDEVYVDITHSFRSLSIFQYMMTSFIENLADKNVKIKKILYGMLDVKSEMKDDAAPIVDLTVINELNHWIKGIYELESYGNGYLIASLLQDQNPELSNNIKNLTDRININYLKDLKDEKESANWHHLGQINGPGSIASM
jgi:CRISPR-associated Csx2 family protein